MLSVSELTQRCENSMPERVGTIDDPGPVRHIMSSFLREYKNILSSGAEINNASVVSCLNRAVVHEIEIDNVAHQLLVRNKNLVIHDILKAYTSRLMHEYGIVITTSTYTKDQISHLKNKNMFVPESSAFLPPPEKAPLSINDIGAVSVNATFLKEANRCLREVYYTETLLRIARKAVSDDGTTISYTATRSGIKRTAALPVWNGTDGIEMLRKTAVRNFIKYLAVPQKT